MKVAKALVRAREASGLTQAQLAKKLRVSAGTVGGWEAGDHGIRLKRLQKIAKVLNVDVAALVG